MKISAVLFALALPLAASAFDNPLKRCKNHYILTQPTCPEPAAGWVPAAPLHTHHGQHTATLLADGRVLIAGDTGVPEMTAEIYDPRSDSWTLTAPMTRDRLGHTATRLHDGRVLVVGGELPDGHLDYIPVEGSAEIFDPASGEWTTARKLATPRGGFTATLLPNGKVLVAGGLNRRDQSLASAELYDPATGGWEAAAALQVARFWHTATALADGNVLVVGGWYDDDAQMQVSESEIYDWKSGAWSIVHQGTGRSHHTATRLDDGRVLIAGGFTSGFRPDGWRLFWTLGTAEIFDPATGEWSDAGSIGTPRYGHLAAALPGDRLLMVQGAESYRQPPNVLYRAVLNAMQFSPGPAWKDLGIPATEALASTVTRLEDGSLLFVGANRAVIYRP